jgi:CBS-domain-containing membrane protein
MLIRDVMTSPAITVPAQASVKDGLRLLDEHRVTSLPVVDENDRIVGVVSEIDLLRGAVRHDPRSQMLSRGPAAERPRLIEDVMSTPALTVTADSDLGDAVELMTSTVVKSFPVVDGKRVVGVVSRSDVVHVLARSDEEIRDEVDELLRSAGVVGETRVLGGIVTIAGLDDPGQGPAAEAIVGSVSGVIAVRLV